ncbi:hypothetical protein HPB51_010868 [Rhipicephalus microplus]|uniref:Ig-like domain-containing protein n=1 Tax=Rhipicephalus microplus TaxID=6941 RepID=A0A9J6DLQ0_RHIMP|nr:hypothetical protein HPB51_010868 [Rhipicephalus microplus]
MEEPRVHVVGVLGERASLPCDMTPNTTDDEVSLVLWYKDDSTTPIYSCDARRSSLSQAHHAPADWLGHRAYLRLGPPEEPAGGQAALELYPVHEEDEGLYRCRVDFRKARTRNYEVVLKVICEWSPFLSFLARASNEHASCTDSIRDVIPLYELDYSH